MSEDAGALKSGHYKLVSRDEDIQSQPVYLVAPKGKDLASGLGGWGIFWQEASMNIAGDRRLNLTDHRVLAVLNARLDFENWIRISQQEIGDFLGVKRPNISVSMKKLVEIGIIIPGPSVKNVHTFRLNPAVAWKGDLRQGAKERRKALKVVQGGKSEPEEGSLIAAGLGKGMGSSLTPLGTDGLQERLKALTGRESTDHDGEGW